MRTLAIGDIHGCFTALQTLADHASIDRDDLVIGLGDYVDRGPDSSAVIDWLIHRHKMGKLIALRGNHELMMLAARQQREYLSVWRACGGDETLESYRVDDKKRASLDDVPAEHWTFLETQTRRYFEVETHFFVHATVAPEVRLEDQEDHVLYWEKFEPTFSSPHVSGKIMVCGHTPRRDGVPISHGHTICLDTWAYKNQWLTCLDIHSNQYWQANQQGEVRGGWLK